MDLLEKNRFLHIGVPAMDRLFWLGRLLLVLPFLACVLLAEAVGLFVSLPLWLIARLLHAMFSDRRR